MWDIDEKSFCLVNLRDKKMIYAMYNVQKEQQKYFIAKVN